MLSDVYDEEKAIRKNVQELKRIYINSNNNSRLGNEIIKSVEELKKELTDDVKKGNIHTERIRNSFKKLNAKIDNIQEKVLKELESLPPSQQDSVATFWEISSEFLTKLFDWFLIKYKKIVKQIKEGILIAVNKIEQFIGTAVIWIKDVFDD